MIDQIASDPKLFTRVECLELFHVALQGKQQVADLGRRLGAARNARPSLNQLVLRGCKLLGESFEGVFNGEGAVRIEGIS